jgi:hypothetical protein
VERTASFCSLFKFSNNLNVEFINVQLTTYILNATR